MMHVGQMPCPQGCGQFMMFATEAAANACRFCQSKAGFGIQHGQTVGGSNSAFPMPSQQALPPQTVSTPLPNQQSQQPALPSHVVQVGQKSPEELNQMRIAKGMPPLPIPGAQNGPQPAFSPPQGQSSSLDRGAVESDLQRLMTIGQEQFAAFMDTMSRLAVAVQAKAALAPPQTVVEVPTAPAPFPLLESDYTPEILDAIRNAQTNQTASPAPVTAAVNGGHVVKTTCLACNVESIGVKVDSVKLPHTCAKGQATQPQK